MIQNLLVLIFSFTAGFLPPTAPLEEGRPTETFPTLLDKATLAHGYDPIAVYLTWQNDPTTTMTIQWISFSDEKENLVKFHDNRQNSSWQVAIGRSLPLASKSPYLLHRVEITGLEPSTEYTFQISQRGVEYKFKTLPRILEAPLRFVVGGDIYHDTIQALRETNSQAAKTNPAFALQGGDLAYNATKPETWVTWLSVWKQTMVTPDGCLIPMIPAIGNHDTAGYFGHRPKNAPLFYTLFRPAGSAAYYTFDVSDYLALTVLDTGHTNAIDGKQTRWLGDVLRKRMHSTHKFALYHVPAYPSVRKFNSKRSSVVRKHWVPLFEKYGLNTAFEHHDHCYKRTVPIRNGLENSSGVLYIGDGAWGVIQPRHPRNSPEQWYLAKAVPVRHFVLVTLEKNRQHYEAIDFMGNRFDYHSSTLLLQNESHDTAGAM